jgi:hypothetical protein
VPLARVAGSSGPAPAWWRPWRIALAGLAGALVLVFAFLFRFNTLGGAIGGFDNDHFIYLIRAERLLAGDQPLRDFVDAELRGAWPALTYAMSAWAQQVGGRTLLPEAYLTAGLTAVAHLVVFLVALAVSRSWSTAFLAAAAAIATVPKLYNYQKVIVLALAGLAIHAVATRPATWRLVGAALLTAAAVLFRHDFGVYVAAGVLPALIVRDLGQLKSAVRNVAVYVLACAAFLLPSAIWIQVYEGVPQYIRASLASVAVERTRTELRLPAFDLSMPLSFDNMELLSYLVFWAVPIAAAVAVLARLTGWKGSRLTPESAATGGGLLVMTVLANSFFLRANLAERVGDAAPAVVLLAAWIAGSAASWTSEAGRRMVIGVPLVLLLATAGLASAMSEVPRELETSGLSDSWDKTITKYRSVRQELAGLPPAVWRPGEDAGILAASRYLAECTRPEDRVLTIGPIHEVPVFARRTFAGGQAMFKLSLYTSEADQRRALAVLENESVPVVIADAEDFEEGFAADYPLVAAHVARQYRAAGTISVEGEPRIEVLVATNRRPAGTDDVSGLPCFR